MIVKRDLLVRRYNIFGQTNIKISFRDGLLQLNMAQNAYTPWPISAVSWKS